MTGQALKLAALASADGYAVTEVAGWSFVLSRPNASVPEEYLQKAREVAPLAPAAGASRWILSAKRVHGTRPSATHLAFAQRFAEACGAGADCDKHDDIIAGTWHWLWFAMAESAS